MLSKFIEKAKSYLPQPTRSRNRAVFERKTRLRRNQVSEEPPTPDQRRVPRKSEGQIHDYDPTVSPVRIGKWSNDEDEKVDQNNIAAQRIYHSLSLDSPRPHDEDEKEKETIAGLLFLIEGQDRLIERTRQDLGLRSAKVMEEKEKKKTLEQALEQEKRRRAKSLPLQGLDREREREGRPGFIFDSH